MRKAIFFCFVVAINFATKAQVVGVETIRYHHHKASNIIFVSDGFDSSAITSFIPQVTSLANYLFSIPVFEKSQYFFNTYGIKVISEENGAANSPQTPIQNYFGSTFGFGGLARKCFAARVDSVEAVVARSIPGFDRRKDKVVVLVNDLRYGGSTGPGFFEPDSVFSFVTMTLDGQYHLAPKILVHEFAHLFAELGDEYLDLTFCGTYPAIETPNVTNDPASHKWDHWLGYPGIDYFPNANYCPDWFKPSLTCLLGDLAQNNVCVVCQEHILYVRNQEIGLIKSSFPLADSVNMALDEDTVFTVDIFQTTDSTIVIEWFVDGVFVSNQKEMLYERKDSSEHTVWYQVTDTTWMVRIDKDTLTRNWTIPAIEFVPDTTVIDSGRIVERAFINPDLLYAIDRLDTTTIPTDTTDTIDTVDVVQTVEIKSMNIVPNPARDKIRVEIGTYMVYNYLGQLVQEGKTEDGVIDINNLTVGVYVVKVMDGYRNVWTGKLLKE